MSNLILSCQAVSKSFGLKPLFENVSLGLFDDSRIGLIGPNGSGKSTLLKILTGLETPDDGQRSVSKNARIEYLPQEDHFGKAQTVQEAMQQALGGVKDDDVEKLTRINIMLSKVGFADAEQKIKELSGGWRKRLAIACALVKEPNLLFMDEPTNHLDLEGILWLEKFLKNAPFAYLIISHDRYFLESVATQVIELNKCYPQGCFSAPGNYSDFLTQREEFLLGQKQTQESLANKVRREVEWLQRGPKARTTKANSRIKEAHQLIEDLAEIKYRNTQNQSAQIDFSSSDRKTKKLILIEHLQKSLGNKKLFTDVSFKLSPGIRLGLLGANGSGKSTLLKILTGKITPDSGLLETAEALRIVNFDQNREQLDKKLTLRQALTPYGDQVIYRDRPIHVSTWAKRFLFSNDQLEIPLSRLSGGEQARILIARLMQQPADVLILDEPTNDLDIPTLEVLEESLLEFPGAIVLVTHDRYLLDRVSTHLLALDGAGGSEFFAEYSQWEALQETQKRSKNDNEKNTKSSSSSSAKKPKRLSYQEQREWDQIEANLLNAEKVLEKCQNEVAAPEIISDAKKLQEACKQLKTAENALETLYARWSELEEKQQA